MWSFLNRSVNLWERRDGKLFDNSCKRDTDTREPVYVGGKWYNRLRILVLKLRHLLRYRINML